MNPKNETIERNGTGCKIMSIVYYLCVPASIKSSQYDCVQ